MTLSTIIGRTYHSVTLDNPTLPLAAPLVGLAKDPSVQSKAAEVARQIFTNGNITVNLLPALAAGLLALAAAFFLLPLLFPAGGDVATGYGAPEISYGEPDAGYAAPSDGYGYRSVRSSYSSVRWL